MCLMNGGQRLGWVLRVEDECLIAHSSIYLHLMEHSRISELWKLDDSYKSFDRIKIYQPAPLAANSVILSILWVLPGLASFSHSSL